MKKIKAFFTGILSVLSCLLCFAISGCASEGAFIENSLNYYFIIYNSLESVTVNYSFQVSVPSKVSYEIEYDASVSCKGIPVISKHEKKNVLPDNNESKTISEYWMDISYTSGAVESDYTIRIDNVTVTPKKSDDSYQNYAIGFGTVGGAALIASTVLFIVLKKRDNK